MSIACDKMSLFVKLNTIASCILCSIITIAMHSTKSIN